MVMVLFRLHEALIDLDVHARAVMALLAGRKYRNSTSSSQATPEQ
jgi:hypothetical protein